MPFPVILAQKVVVFNPMDISKLYWNSSSLGSLLRQVSCPFLTGERVRQLTSSKARRGWALSFLVSNSWQAHRALQFSQVTLDKISSCLLDPLQPYPTGNLSFIPTQIGWKLCLEFSPFFSFPRPMPKVILLSHISTTAIVSYPVSLCLIFLPVQSILHRVTSS